MFMDAEVACAFEGANQRDDDGAKRVFFGGERFIEGISGQAYVIQIIYIWANQCYNSWIILCSILLIMA